MADGIFECDLFYESTPNTEELSCLRNYLESIGKPFTKGEEEAMSLVRLCGSCCFFDYNHCTKGKKGIHKNSDICHMFTVPCEVTADGNVVLNGAKYPGRFEEKTPVAPHENPRGLSDAEIRAASSTGECSCDHSRLGWVDPTRTDFEKDLDEVLAEMKSFLLFKNKTYGDSALNPVRILSKADPIEQIKVRIDDKLSRFARGEAYPSDNDVKDTSGYFLIWQIAELRKGREGK
jgi:hypothetical protein